MRTLQQSTGFHRLKRVLDDVVECLLELVAIHFHQREIVPQFLLHHDAPVLDLRLQERQGFPHQRIHAFQLLLQPRRPDGAEKLLHDRVQPRDFLPRDAQRFVKLRARTRRNFAQLPLHELEMDVQRVQRIADFMRHSGGEQREGGELFALNRLLRGAARLGDVPQDHRVSHHLRLSRLGRAWFPADAG